MTPRTLDQIIAELNPTYDPQINNLRQRQSLIPQQIQEEEKGLQARQENAFSDIVSGARRRGLGFSGIPLGEQAKYTSTEFLPALARLRQTGREQAISLEDAILGITERRNTLAQQLRQQEVSQAEQIRQFNENLALQREQMAAQERAARASAASSFSPSLGSPASASSSSSTRNRPGTLRDEQWAYNSVASMLSSRDDKGLMSDYLATAASAKNGNIGDLYKLQMYRAKRPDLFKARYGWEKNYGF